MADELFQGVKIKALPLTTTINDTDDFVIEDSVPTTRRTRFSSLVTAIKNKIAPDSGWQTVVLTNNFVEYSAGSAPKYRKVGEIVNIQGVVKPTKEITSGTTSITIGSLPTGYRPFATIAVLCHGSSRNRWLCQVGTDGTISLSRYGNGTEYVNPINTSWLPFNVTFMTI